MSATPKSVPFTRWNGGAYAILTGRAGGFRMSKKRRVLCGIGSGRIVAAGHALYCSCPLFIGVIGVIGVQKLSAVLGVVSTLPPRLA